MADVEDEVLDEDVGRVIDPRCQPILDDLPGAARSLWEALMRRVSHEKFELEERAGVAGAVWRGSVNAVINELWPFLAARDAEAVSGAVTVRRELFRYLKESGNAVSQGAHGRQGGEWWVRASWNPVNVSERTKTVTAEVIRAWPEEKKARKRELVIADLVKYAVENRVDEFTTKLAQRVARIGSVTMYGLWDDVVALNEAVQAALPPYRCPFEGCGRRFEALNNLGRHKVSCPHNPAPVRPGAVEETRDETEEIDIMANASRTLRQQINELKRRYAALFAFATLEGCPIPKSAAGDLAVAGFSKDVRDSALAELLKSGVLRVEKVGGPGEGRGFDTIVATDPRAALRGSSVDRAEVTAATLDGAPIDYHAVLTGLLAELDLLRKRDAKNTALREALKGLAD